MPTCPALTWPETHQQAALQCCSPCGDEQQTIDDDQSTQSKYTLTWLQGATKEGVHSQTTSGGFPISQPARSVAADTRWLMQEKSAGYDG
jgi:hypothetical protein